jgi:hypothetical protein
MMPPKPKHPKEPHPSKVFSQSTSNKGQRVDPAASEALSSSVSLQPSSVSENASKAAVEHLNAKPKLYADLM